MSASRKQGKAERPSQEPAEAPRGHAAWKAAKQRISDKNEAAYARGRQERLERNARAMQDRHAADRRERSNLPVQPEGHSAASPPEFAP